MRFLHGDIKAREATFLLNDDETKVAESKNSETVENKHNLHN